jgi:two-component system, NarL family, sensor kinase
MNEVESIVLAVVVGTVLVLTMVFFAALLLVVNANRRHRHRAELAELKLERDQEVNRAEREATRQALDDVGRELHDNVGQLLTMVQMALNLAVEGHHDGSRMETARDTLEQSIQEIRRLGHDLSTDLWQQRSFADALKAEAARLERVARLSVTVEFKGTPPEPPADDKFILYRVFQEIVQNTLKHSQASSMSIQLNGANGFELLVCDDGRGFDPENVRANAGLRNIQSRCAVIGFQATCSSMPGAGCQWRITRVVVEEGAPV